jgi:hypothetical protein
MPGEIPAETAGERKPETMTDRLVLEEQNRRLIEALILAEAALYAANLTGIFSEVPGPNTTSQKIKAAHRAARALLDEITEPDPGTRTLLEIVRTR